MDKELKKVIQGAWQGKSAEPNKQQRMTATIGDIVMGNWCYLSLDLCPTCNGPFAFWEPENPGDHFHQVVTTNLCHDCSKKSNEGVIPIHMFSDSEEVEQYRKEQGLPPYKVSLSEQRNKWKQSYNNAQDYDDGLMGMTDKEATDMAYFYEGGTNPNRFDEDYYDPHADYMADLARGMGVY